MRIPIRTIFRILVLGGLVGGVLNSCSPSLPTAPDRATSAAVRMGRGNGGGGNGGGGSEIEDQIVLILAPGADAAALAAEFQCELVEWQPTEACATLLPDAAADPAMVIAALLLDPRVVTAETDEWIEPSEARQQSFAFDDGFGSPSSYASQPAAQAVDLERAHRVSRGRGVRVAVLDTGIDPNHPAIARQYVGGRDFIDDDAFPTDEANDIDDDADGGIDEAFGHGTHVAGIIALTAPEAELLIIRVLDADGRGDVAKVAAGIRYAITQNVQVINLSLGMLKHSDGIQHALEEAEYRGIVVVTSAGNWGSENPREFPASSSHARSVAAVSAAATPAPFTSFANDVAVSAPGMGIRSAYPGNAYRIWSGTSMSAPFVAGTAALLLQIHPSWNADRIFLRIAQTARTITDVSPQQLGKLGSGALDAGAALWPDYQPEWVDSSPGDLDPSADPADLQRQRR